MPWVTEYNSLTLNIVVHIVTTGLQRVRWRSEWNNSCRSVLSGPVTSLKATLVQSWPCLDTEFNCTSSCRIIRVTGSSPYIPSLPEGETCVSKIHFMESLCSRTLFGLFLSLLPLPFSPSLHSLRNRALLLVIWKPTTFTATEFSSISRQCWISLLSRSVFFIL